jgi:hypothetical protein
MILRHFEELASSDDWEITDIIPGGGSNSGNRGGNRGRNRGSADLTSPY